MMIFDRLTGARWTGSNFVAGQLVELSAGHPSYLVADRHGVVTINKARYSILDGDLRLADRTLDAHAEAILAAPMNWDGLATVPLVAPEVDAPRRLERLLGEANSNLPHLAHVLHAPRTRLRDEERLVPVSRARKPARSATRRLAGHSEDWLMRGARSVRPKRVLTRRVDLDVDLYENRVAVTLLEEQLPAAIRFGISELRELEAGYSELTEALEDDSTFQRQWRLSSLWDSSGGQSNVLDAYAQLLVIIDQANALRGRLRRLGGAPLPKALTGKRPPTGPLRQTNILLEDEHYRATAELWRLATIHAGDQETETARAERLRRRHRAFTLLATALIARTLRQLGFTPAGGDNLEYGIELTRAAGAAELQLDDADTIVLRAGGIEHRIVPLIADLERVPLDHVPPKTTVAYLGSGRDTGRHDFDRCGKPTVVPVNLLEPVSAERIGRVVLDVVLSPTIRTYPVAVQRNGQPVAPRLREDLSSHAPVAVEGEHVRMIRPPTPPERESLRKWLSLIERRASRPGWEQEHRDQLPELRHALEAAADALERLLSCPSCEQQTDHRDFRVRGGTSYRVECPGCGTAWGTSVCGKCRATFATLTMTSAANHDTNIGSPHDLERLLGRDQLASPCWISPAAGSDFICPECSACSADGTANSLACARCRKPAGSAAGR